MRYFFTLLLVVGQALSVLGQTPRIQNIRLSVDERAGTVQIMYDLTGVRTGDSILVVLNGTRSGRITPRSVQGDLGTKVKAGPNRTITWNALQDNVNVDEDVVVTFSITPQVQTPVSARPSPVVSSPPPQKATSPAMQRKPSIVLPVVGFALAAGLGAYSQLKPTNYDAYQEKTIAAPSQTEIDQINQQIGLKQIAYVAAAVIAVADVSYLFLRKKTQPPRTALSIKAPSGIPSLGISRTF